MIMRIHLHRSHGLTDKIKSRIMENFSEASGAWRCAVCSCWERRSTHSNRTVSFCSGGFDDGDDDDDDDDNNHGVDDDVTHIKRIQ